MLAAERRDMILSQLEKDGRVLVSDLSGIYGVSEETIRRDLEKLEEEGLARRCYGGASFTGGHDLPYSVRKKSNVAGKRRIAAAVAGMIPDGASVVLDGSSTATFVAQALRDKQALTVITHSLEIALLLSDREDWQILLAGGALRGRDLALTGARAEEFIADYHTGWAVISCRGLDLVRGVSDAQEDLARIKRAMLSAAEHSVLAVDSRKFGRRDFAAICPLSRLDTVVTDLEPDATWRDAFAEQNVTLLVG